MIIRTTFVKLVKHDLLRRGGGGEEEQEEQDRHELHEHVVDFASSSLRDCPQLFPGEGGCSDVDEANDVETDFNLRMKDDCF